MEALIIALVWMGLCFVYPSAAMMIVVILCAIMLILVPINIIGWVGEKWPKVTSVPTGMPPGWPWRRS
jgi:MFS superfamily sulfate permease-like transporter